MDGQKQDSKYGSFTRNTTCRCCRGSNITTVMDFGSIPLAGGFLKAEQFNEEEFYPLTIGFCNNCFLVQVMEAVPPETLFKDYFYFSSAIQTLVDHCTRWAQDVYDRFLRNRENPCVFEIGCNDGVMLKPFAALGVRAVGIDPAKNVVESVKQEGFDIINDFFNERVSRCVQEKYGQFDMITSSYSFAHIEDIASALKGVKELLKPDGVFIFEVYYLGTMIEEFQYDMIYHEHCNYYSLKALQNFLGREGFEIFDITITPGVRSGAARFYAQHKATGMETVSDSVKNIRRDEEEKRYNKAETFIIFGEAIKKTKNDLMTLLNQLKEKEKTIIGYGASGRGTMIMNYCGIDGKYLDYVVDDAPAKHGFYTPGTHVIIEPWEYTEKTGWPDYVLLFAWSFADEVKKKRIDYLKSGGAFIIPLPEVRIETVR